MTPEWHTRAACAGIIALFYPPDGDEKTPGETRAEQARRERDAIAICGGCPVRHPCAQAGEQEEHGIWGGWTEKQRVDMRRGYQPRPVGSGLCQDCGRSTSKFRSRRCQPCHIRAARQGAA